MPQGDMNYIEIPAKDLKESVRFYETVFGWKVEWKPAVQMQEGKQRADYPQFSDPSGSTSGGFVLDRAPAKEPGLLPYIEVSSIDATLEAIQQNGGEVVKPRTPIVEGKDWLAIFCDPAGNALALYEWKAET